MADTAKIEEEIRQLLASDLDSVTLSNKLFSQQGLFAALGPTEEHRRAIIQTPLFREAQWRVSELQRLERDAFVRALADRKTLEQIDAER